MHIILDHARCEGHGLCAEVAPKLMHLDEQGNLILDVEHVDEADQAAVDAAKAAVRVCPVAALKLR
jgi:ferredoxin